MDRQQILLAKSLEAAAIPLCTDTFGDRLILQKAVYLLQSAGIQLGYRFRWYLKGPYSPDLTMGAFGILGEGETAQTELAGWKLDAKSTALIQGLKPLLTTGEEQKGHRARHLELLASVLFLLNTSQANAHDPEGISTILKKNGKAFDATDVRQALKELKTHGLLAETHVASRK
jgi:uncharacterized protein YwgA